jgi:hypothetical protein
MDKAGFKAIKQLLALTIKKEIEYERYRSKIFEKTIDELKKLNLKIEIKSQNNKVHLQGKNFNIDFRAKCPFKITNREVFDDESPENQFVNDELEFQISVLKKSEKIVFDIFSDYKELYIRSIAVSNGKDLLAVRHFSALDQSTQEEFTKYLQTRVSTSSISNIIDSYSLERYDELYLEWLENIEKMLNSE